MQGWALPTFAGSSEIFPLRYYNLIETDWNDRIASVSCACDDPRTQGSYSFNGTSTYASAPSGAWFTGGDFSISAWVKPSAIKNDARIIDFGNGAQSDNVILAASIGTTGTPGFTVYKNGVAASVLAAPSESEIRMMVSGRDYPSDSVWTYEKARYQMTNGSTWYDASINRQDATRY